MQSNLLWDPRSEVAGGARVLKGLPQKGLGVRAVGCNLVLILVLLVIVVVVVVVYLVQVSVLFLALAVVQLVLLLLLLLSFVLLVVFVLLVEQLGECQPKEGHQRASR
jgi:hypothetical protein